MTNDLKLIAPTEPTAAVVAAAAAAEKEGERERKARWARWVDGGVGTVTACMNGWMDG